jgi:two-component sensor histidine kinase
LEVEIRANLDRCCKRALELRWTETGGPPVQTPTQEGFGRRVIRQLAEKLNGSARFDWREEGLDCKITAQT